MSKERPILMSAPMVRATIDDTKTQTRRTTGLDTVNDNPGEWVPLHVGNLDGRYSVLFVPAVTNLDNIDVAADRQVNARCPYGQVGDRLWVRETFTYYGAGDSHVAYRATDEERMSQNVFDKWKPSIHMPRKFSRITLEITGVRVEQLQEISEEDAIAEGCDYLLCSTCNGSGTHPYGDACSCDGGYQMEPAPLAQYRDLWESINGPSSWDPNPWVWVVNFRRIEQESTR